MPIASRPVRGLTTTPRQRAPTMTTADLARRRLALACPPARGSRGPFRRFLPHPLAPARAVIVAAILPPAGPANLPPCRLRDGTGHVANPLDLAATPEAIPRAAIPQAATPQAAIPRAASPRAAISVGSTPAKAGARTAARDAICRGLPIGLPPP